MRSEGKTQPPPCLQLSVKDGNSEVQQSTLKALINAAVCVCVCTRAQRLQRWWSRAAAFQSTARTSAFPVRSPDSMTTSTGSKTTCPSTPLKQMTPCPTTWKTTHWPSLRWHSITTARTSASLPISPASIQVPRSTSWWTVSVTLESVSLTRKYRKVMIAHTNYSSLCVLADGPLRVDISGPGSAHMGSIVTLTCSALSRPDCEFYWHIGSLSPVLQSGSVITFPATKEHEGTYTCVARNPVTNITLHQSKVFVVGEWAAPR